METTRDCIICLGETKTKVICCNQLICENCIKAWNKDCPHCRSKNWIPKEIQIQKNSDYMDYQLLLIHSHQLITGRRYRSIESIVRPLNYHRTAKQPIYYKRDPGPISEEFL